MRKSAIYQKKRRGAPRWANKWIQSPTWLIGFGVAVALCLLAYTLNAYLGRVHPGSTWGLAYGTAAAVLMMGAIVYGLRRRTMRLRPGRTWYYLQFHVYGGTLFLLLVFMHSGFSTPHGVLAWMLWILSIWITVSGLLGIVIQKWIPTLLASGLRTEVHYDRVPELVEEIRKRSEQVVAECDHQIRTFYQKQLAPALGAPQPRLIYFFDITGGLRSRDRQFAYLGEFLPAEEKGRLDTLHKLFKTKLEIDAHYTLQRVLRGWLYTHTPLSILLMVLLALHLFAVLYY